MLWMAMQLQHRFGLEQGLEMLRQPFLLSCDHLGPGLQKAAPEADH